MSVAASPNQLVLHLWNSSVLCTVHTTSNQHSSIPYIPHVARIMNLEFNVVVSVRGRLV